MTQASEPAVAAQESKRRQRGGCACGAVRYEVELARTRPSPRTSSVWERIVGSTGFRLLSGDESLSGYQFADASVQHFYCVRCGVRSFSYHAAEPAGDFYSFDLKCLQ